MNNISTKPGMHHSFPVNSYFGEERSILDKLSKEWLLTYSGKPIRLASSSYEYFLMKPTSVFKEMFNIEREIICIFSSYTRFEPRTLDAFNSAQEELGVLRTETVCRVLISKDSNIEDRLDSLLKTDPEQPIIIPFTYDEILAPYDSFFLRNRFRKHFYSRDLFDFLSPLKSDLYFLVEVRWFTKWLINIERESIPVYLA